ncbi:MAG: DNA mismatch repair protein MutS [Paracoccaceae bacterium]|nr:DNA mismatch repair protein MutS [Paracoccaceae bacterium]
MNSNTKSTPKVKDQSNITPLMEQYLEIKRSHPGALLFFRMGDFYELFFDDAYLASDILNITLTKRGKLNGKDIPMCGVPHHASDRYIETLIKRGLHIAICEQTETPDEAKKRGYKAIVNRDVIRIITPGTVVEDNFLEGKKSNFLLSINDIRGDLSIAWTDISTGNFFVRGISQGEIESSMARIKPSEILISNNYAEKNLLGLKEKNYKVTVVSGSSFNTTNSHERLLNHYGVKSIKSFGNFSYSMIGALGAILDYILVTQSGTKIQLMRPVLEKRELILEIDEHTRKNLEINISLAGEKKGSLIGILDRTVTSFGSRLLSIRANAPLSEKKSILERLSVTQFFSTNPEFSESLRQVLIGCPDFERALSRLTFHKSSFQDLIIVKKGIVIASKVKKLFTNMSAQETLPKKLDSMLDNIFNFKDVLILLNRALSEIPLEIFNKTSFVNSGYDSELDNLRSLLNQSETLVKKLEEDLILNTSISSLKIKQNNVLGYFIELTSKNAEALSESGVNENFIHRQTTANTVRFTTNELISLESQINSATSKMEELEKRVYKDIQKALLDLRSEIRGSVGALGELDFFSTLGLISREENWIKPEISDKKILEIWDGRHPVVEKNVKEKSDYSFIPNDCKLNEKTTTNLITGPNMAGKSTFLKQNALIVILAQMGSFVPANKAKIGLTDRVFSRIGASDDLSQGHSTFMVEMLETATILNQATENSFVILDEIGRGTSTFDGLSIAWSTLEHLHNQNRCRTLFATHYHELTVLDKELPLLSNLTVKIKEYEGELIFLHKIVDGFSNHSFGIKVAKLAGIPEKVTDRALDILNGLENNSELNRNKKGVLRDISQAQDKMPQNTIDQRQINHLLQSLNVDDLSPKEALHFLYKIQRELKH